MLEDMALRETADVGGEISLRFERKDRLGEKDVIIF